MLAMRSGVAVLVLLQHALVQGQFPGTATKNSMLDFPIQICQEGGNCQKVSTTVSLDSNWRWVHDESLTNCYDGNLWDDELCPDAATCSENCFLEGVSTADWKSPYGIEVDGKGAMSMKFVTIGPYSTNIGSRVFLVDESGDQYYKFNLKNKEFAMDVDVSQLPCGLNGAVYFVEMDLDGGLSYPTNEAGPAYGTGYCDAQCPHDMKYINGEANCEEWEPSDNDVNSGKGHYGSCCFELDLWEANTQGNAFTNHPCDAKIVGGYMCEGTECGDNASDERYDGVCDKDGCDFNPWRMGDRTFYGEGSDFTIDTTKPLTYVTQFITDDGTDSGELVEIRRVWVQDGQVIENTQTNQPGMQNWDSITEEMCAETKVVFDDMDDHAEKGGLKAMGDSMDRGHVLVMSFWDDHDASMLWLDSDYPLDKDPSIPGVSRGPCPQDSGDPADMESTYPDATVFYSNVKIGPLGSTYGDGGAPTTSHPTQPTQPTQPTNPPHTTTTTRPSGGGCVGGTLDSCISGAPWYPCSEFQHYVEDCFSSCQGRRSEMSKSGACPGGSLDACILLVDWYPCSEFQHGVEDCMANCT